MSLIELSEVQLSELTELDLIELEEEGGSRIIYIRAIDQLYWQNLHRLLGTMNTLGEHIVRWIRRSIYKWFVTDSTYQYRLEEDEKKIDQGKPWFELRITGPRWREISKGTFNIDVEIDFLCCCIVGHDIYLLDRLVGYLTNKLTAIPIHNDSGIQIACLNLRNDIARPVDVVPWGKPDPKTKIQVCGIEAYYRVQL